MIGQYGAQSMVAPLRTVVVRRPDEAFGECDAEAFHYTAQPDLEAARAEHDGLVAVLERAGVEILRHEEPLPGLADAIFVHDSVIVTDAGTVVLRMGKELRRGEEEAQARFLEAHGVPVLGRLEGEATAEGGDLVWLDHDTLWAGLGYRTNEEGARQLAGLLEPLGVEVSAFDLPVGAGPAACLHLQSLISLVAEDLAVVRERSLPVRLWQLLRGRGIDLIDVPDGEQRTHGTNVLAIAPRKVLMLEGNPETKARLEAHGCEVHTYRGREITLKAEGGATCLTRPVWRAG